MPDFIEKIKGALYGIAIGDAMGAPVEGWTSDGIRKQFHDHDFAEFLPVTHKNDPSTGKGFGRITDDTLMTEALIRAYSNSRRHMDAYDFETFMLYEMTETVVWLPERQCRLPIIERIWYPEKYPWMRMMGHSVDPRSAGAGNCVNCGVAMYIMPIGAVNAGDSWSAYQEAAAFGLAHNESYAVEGAAVLAAFFANAFRREGTFQDSLEKALLVARDGTKKAIAAVMNAVDPNDSVDTFIGKTRQAFFPYGEPIDIDINTDDKANQFIEGNDAGRPSRMRSIEELPIALAAVKYGNGDFIKTLRSAVMYGRDCDSIAGMAMGVFGALYGMGGIPEHLRKASDEANRRNYGKMAEDFHQVIREIFQKDQIVFRQKAEFYA